jgi:restriction endonuclease Mrr
LIDGKQLTEYLLDLNVRVTTSATDELKQVDSDHFTKE